MERVEERFTQRADSLAERLTLPGAKTLEEVFFPGGQGAVQSLLMVDSHLVVSHPSQPTHPTPPSVGTAFSPPPGPSSPISLITVGLLVPMLP